ncbi:precorrin-6A synthase (deacetylating) [Rhizobium sp. HT1-10]|uniref:precorrin-6A synthase (deacetylating) n=1 Tax=Rhizobium sp. HT1-10 TaxID=3111638 RepID=UPI003C2424BB
MRHLYLIGIGTGNPEHMTVQGINALNAVDVVFIPDKGEAKTGLADVRREICARYLTRQDTPLIAYDVPVRQTADRSYTQGVDAWHADIAAVYEQMLTDNMAEDGSAALLVWGDPGLYDSTIRILQRVLARGNVAVDYSVIPGITSIQALTASHRIPLNLVGKPVEITTGRRLAASFPALVGTAVVMLDGEQAFAKIEDPDAFIYWGAYLGTDDEILLSGRLADVAPTIAATRAAARARHGWIMDIYLLRKGQDFDD